MDENKFNNFQNNQPNNVENMNEKKGRGLFYFVIAFAVIIISVVGATYAYFTASARTPEENSVTAGSSSLTLGLETDSSGLKTSLIPVADNIAKFAYAEQKTVTYNEGKCKEYEFDEEGNPVYQLDPESGEQVLGEDGQPIHNCLVKQPDKNSTCIDDSGTEVCSYYTYSVVNQNSSRQDITMYFGTNSNDFENLWFMVYTDTETVDAEGATTTVRTRITDPQPVKTNNDEEKEVKLTVRADKAEDQTFLGLVNPSLETVNSRATYTIVLWIKELDTGTVEDGTDDDDADDDQTTTDGNKNFSGYVRVTSGDGAGVTGVINQANDYDDTTEPEPTTPTTQTSPTEPTTETSPTE